MQEEAQLESNEEAFPALQELREQVDAATREIQRLRRENEQLRDRVRHLQQRPEVKPDQAFVTFDEKPATLRRKVEGFIDAIDHYLDEEESS